MWKARKGAGCPSSFKMAPDMQMFLFLFKSKYRRKLSCHEMLSWFIIAFLCVINVISGSKCIESQCVNGMCVNGTCQCYDGWQGTNCQFCGGKVR